MLDFRSPTLGIRRSPLSKAQPWTGVSRAPIVRRLSLAADPAPKDPADLQLHLCLTLANSSSKYKL